LRRPVSTRVDRPTVERVGSVPAVEDTPAAERYSHRQDVLTRAHLHLGSSVDAATVLETEGVVARPSLQQHLAREESMEKDAIVARAGQHCQPAAAVLDEVSDHDVVAEPRVEGAVSRGARVGKDHAVVSVTHSYVEEGAVNILEIEEIVAVLQVYVEATVDGDLDRIQPAVDGRPIFSRHGTDVDVHPVCFIVAAHDHVASSYDHAHIAGGKSCPGE